MSSSLTASSLAPAVSSGWMVSAFLAMKSNMTRIVLFSGWAALLFSATALRSAETGAVDRGPTFSGTVRAGFPGDNYAMKGIVVSLGQETNAFVCFDADLLRMSVAWTGDYLKFGNYMKEIVHPQPPQVAGTPMFATAPGPGWPKDRSFADPRPNQQGPLPKDWAKYRGLFLHERQVVFSYTVGASEVLDLPGFEVLDGLKVFTRTLEMKQLMEQTVLICQVPGVTAKAP